MSRYESACVSLGFKIQVSKLINQINEDNFGLIKNLMGEGFIEDSNGYANKFFKYIIENEQLPEQSYKFKKYIKAKFNNPKIESDAESEKYSDSDSIIELEKESDPYYDSCSDLNSNSDSYSNSGTLSTENTESDTELETQSRNRVESGYEPKKFYGNINKMYLLVPIFKVIETTRWGLRKGINGTSCDLNLDLNDIQRKISDKYEHLLTDYKVVFMLNQEAD